MDKYLGQFGNWDGMAVSDKRRRERFLELFRHEFESWLVVMTSLAVKCKEHKTELFDGF